MLYLEAIPLVCWTELKVAGQTHSTRYETFGDTGVRVSTYFYILQGFSQGSQGPAANGGHVPLYGMEDTNSDGVIDVGEASFVVSGLPLEALGFTFKHIAREYEAELDLPTYLQQAGSTLPPRLLDLSQDASTAWSGVLVKSDWFDDAADAVITSVLDDTAPEDIPEVNAKLDVVRVAKQAYRDAFDLDVLGLSGENCDALIWRESRDYIFEGGVHYCVPADSAFVLNGEPAFEDGSRLTVGPSTSAFDIAAGTEFKLGSGTEIIFRRPVAATGTSSSPVRFERLNGSQAWGSVILAADGNDLDYVAFDGGAENLVVRSQNNVLNHITSENGVVGLQTSAYEVCSPPGGPPSTCYVQQSEFTLTNSTIQNNLYEGIQRINSGSSGTVGAPATATITNTDIILNGGDGVLVADGVTMGGSTVTIDGGTEVRSNGGSGIMAVAAEVVIADEETLIDDNGGSGIVAGSSAEVYVTEATIQNNAEYGVHADYYSEVTFAPPSGGGPLENATVQSNVLGGLFADDHASIDAGTYAKGFCVSACNNSILQSTNTIGLDVKAAGSSTVLAQFDWWGPGVSGASDLDLVEEKGSFIEVEPVRTTPPGSSASMVTGGGGTSTAGRSADSLRVVLIEARAAAAEADYVEAFRLLRDVIRDGDADFRRLAYTEATRLLRESRPAGVMSYLEGIAEGASAYRPWALRALVVAYGAGGRVADAEDTATTLTNAFGETRHELFGHLAHFRLRLHAGNLSGAEAALAEAQAGWPDHSAVLAAVRVLALMQGGEEGRPAGGDSEGAHAMRDGSTVQAKRGGDESSAEAFALEAAYPNPASDRVMVPVVLAEAGHLRVAVFDVLGRQVAVLADEPYAAGRHTLRFEAAGLPAGVYLVRATAEGRKVQSATQKLVLTR